jgi:alpha-L-arabinofuranosidase
LLLSLPCCFSFGDQAIQTEFELEDKQFRGAVEATEVNGPDIKAANNFEGALVKPTPRSAPAQGKTLRYSFLPHSFTMLRAKLTKPMERTDFP